MCSRRFGIALGLLAPAAATHFRGGRSAQEAELQPTALMREIGKIGEIGEIGEASKFGDINDRLNVPGLNNTHQKIPNLDDFNTADLDNLHNQMDPYDGNGSGYQTADDFSHGIADRSIGQGQDGLDRLDIPPSPRGRSRTMDLQRDTAGDLRGTPPDQLEDLRKLKPKKRVQFENTLEDPDSKLSNDPESVDSGFVHVRRPDEEYQELPSPRSSTSSQRIQDDAKAFKMRQRMQHDPNMPEEWNPDYPQGMHDWLDAGRRDSTPPHSEIPDARSGYEDSFFDSPSRKGDSFADSLRDDSLRNQDRELEDHDALEKEVAPLKREIVDTWNRDHNEKERKKAARKKKRDTAIGAAIGGVVIGGVVTKTVLDDQKSDKDQKKDKDQKSDKGQKKDH